MLHLELASLLPIVHDVAQTISFVATPFIAGFGLWSWKAKLRGETRYRVAKDVIAGAYRIRDEIRNLQDLIIVSSEYEDRPPIEGESDQQRRVNDLFFAYLQRYSKVTEALNAWYPAVAEAEALFGDEARKLIERLEEVCYHLRMSIYFYHHHCYQNMNIKCVEQYLNIINGVDPDTIKFSWNALTERTKEAIDDDGFHKELKSSVQGIQKFFSRYIRE